MVISKIHLTDTIRDKSDSTSNMESKWFLFPGQTLANTNVSDRARALHVDTKTWSHITGHLDRNRIQQEAAIEEERHRQELKDGSKAMTKLWPNSIENIRLRKEAQRQERLIKKDEEKVKRFFELRAEQEAIKVEYVKKMKKQIFTSKGYPKTLNNALLFSEVLYERGKQLEFKEFLKQHELDENEKYAEAIKVDVVQHQLDEAEKKTQLAEKRNHLNITLKNQIKQIEETKINKRAKQIATEAIDNVKASEEMDRIKAIEMEEKQKKKQEMFLEKQKFLRQLNEQKLVSEQEERDIDEIIDIHAKAKKRIECLRKSKEAEMQDALIARRLAASKKAVAEQKAKGDDEERRIKAALAERDAVEEEKIKVKVEFNAKMRQERIVDRQQYLDRLEKKRQNENELKRWEMLNRYKTNEAIQEYNKERKIQAWDNVLKYRKELLEQISVENDAKMLELAMEKEAAKDNIQEEHKQFFEYANEIMEQVKSNGRSTYPIERVIQKYKKENELLPKTGANNKKCTCCSK